MSTNKLQNVSKRQAHLLDELQSLLERQIELAHKGNIAEAELLGKKADGLVRKIAQTGLLERRENGNRRDLLRRLYEELRLTIATRSADVAEKLIQVRKGKRTVGAYRSTI